MRLAAGCVDAARSAAPRVAGIGARRRSCPDRLWQRARFSAAPSPIAGALVRCRHRRIGRTTAADRIGHAGDRPDLSLLLRPGDTVLVDDPCYFNFLALLRAHQVKIVGVPMTPSGPDVTRFEAILAATQPRLYITSAALHNPTGATLSLQTAHRLLNAAATCGLTIVEDDILADFEPEQSARR